MKQISHMYPLDTLLRRENIMLRKLLLSMILLLTLAVALPVSAAPPDAPAIISPGGGVTYNTNLPFLEWIGASTATRYRVVFRNALGQVVLARVFRAADVCAGVACAANLLVDPPAPQFTFVNDSYTWRVFAINNDGRTGSTPETFTIDFPGTPVTVAPVSGGELTTRTPSFVWNPVSAADQYRVVVRNLTTGVVRRSAWMNDAAVCVGNECTFVFDQPFPRAGFRWWVLARQVTFPANVSRSERVPFRIVREMLR